MAVSGQAGLLDPAGGYFQRGEQGGGAVADVVVGLFLRQPGADRQDRGGRLNAWTCDFSSTHNTTAFAGGCRYSPTTSRIFASSSGSVENLNVWTRQGCRSHLRQIRATDANPIFSSAASSRAVGGRALPE